MTPHEQRHVLRQGPPGPNWAPQIGKDLVDGAVRLSPRAGLRRLWFSLESTPTGLLHYRFQRRGARPRSCMRTWVATRGWEVYGDPVSLGGSRPTFSSTRWTPAGAMSR